ncbi:MAG: hypothetical protein P4L84_02250 [Isosphaeraceae bacterium]|nr:hypothetical protein [Isosphaeraceae bacterium]
MIDKLLRYRVGRQLFDQLGALCYKIGVFFLQCYEAIADYLDLILQERDSLRLNARSPKPVDGAEERLQNRDNIDGHGAARE